MSNEKSFLIPVSWTVYSTIRVEADSLEEALDTALRKCDRIPISSECEYVDASYVIENDIDMLKAAQDYADISDIIIKKDGTIIS